LPNEDQSLKLNQVVIEPRRSPSPKPCGPETAFGCPRDFLNDRFVYVVISPRARGLSVGVNMNPDNQCNFDCAYREVDRINRPQMSLEKILANILLLARKRLVVIRSLFPGINAQEPPSEEIEALTRNRRNRAGRQAEAVDEFQVSATTIQVMRFCFS
jgi:hypothetical protein